MSLYRKSFQGSDFSNSLTSIDYLPGSLILWDFPLEWVAILSSGNLSGRGSTCIFHLSCTGRWILPLWPPGHLQGRGTAIEKPCWKQTMCGGFKEERRWAGDTAGTEGNWRCVCVHSGGDDQLELCFLWWELQTAFPLRQAKEVRHRRDNEIHCEIPGTRYLHLHSGKLTGRGCASLAEQERTSQEAVILASWKIKAFGPKKGAAQVAKSWADSGFILRIEPAESQGWSE